MNIIVFLFRSIIFTFCYVSFSMAGSVATEVLAAPELIKALQSGGHIIYMRHSTTDLSQKDQDRQNLDDCSKQRNLSAAGRIQAREIGIAIKAYKIPVAKVVSSPYCRCKDTAQLVFGRFNLDPNLGFSISKDKEESQRLGKYLYAEMLKSVTQNKNAVFVGHTSNLRDGLGIWPKPEGVLAVFKKRDNKLVFKGIIKPDEWPEN